VWFGAVVGSFWYLERDGLRARDDDDPTLTGVISRYLPGWLWFTVLGGLKGWLDWHFNQAYESWHEPETYELPR
jgi:hypothetical protein